MLRSDDTNSCVVREHRPVSIGSEGMHTEKEREKLKSLDKTPAELYTELSLKVVGQTDAKKKLCVAAANHLKRIRMVDEDILNRNQQGYIKKVVAKANVLLIGPTGSGKTYMISSLAQNLGIPFASISATSLTPAGYRGNDVEVALKNLFFEAASVLGGKSVNIRNMDDDFRHEVIRKAERGIILIDEVDKLRRTGNIEGEVGGAAIQRALLTMIEGASVNVALGDNVFSDMVSINTSNILFVFAGAFEGQETVGLNRNPAPSLEEIIRKRLMCVPESGRQTVEELNAKLTGLSGRDLLIQQEKNRTSLLGMLADADLETYGFIPEFIGRIPIMAVLESLTADDFVEILTNPKNPDALVNQYRTLFEMDGAGFLVEPEALRWIAKEALAKKRGARGLRTVMEALLTDAMYVTPSLRGEKVTVNLVGHDSSRPPYSRILCTGGRMDAVKEKIRCVTGIFGTEEMEVYSMERYSDEF